MSRPPSPDSQNSLSHDPGTVQKLGFIDYNGDLKISNSLLSVVLRD
jgi:hypothetical protein